jgi:hypothetical protein
MRGLGANQTGCLTIYHFTIHQQNQSFTASRISLAIFPRFGHIRAPRPPAVAYASEELQRSRDLAGRHPGCGCLTFGVIFRLPLDLKRILDVDHSSA